MPRFRSDRPWQAIWRIATSDYLLGAVLLALALALFLAAWLPQTSEDGSSSDVTWQADVQRRFGEAAWLRSTLQAVGAFHVADAVGFRLLLALLAFGLLTRLVESAEALWREWRGGAYPENAPRDASHRLWSKLGTVGIYLGGLIIFVGAIITNVESWQVGPLSVVAGESVSLSNSDNLTLRLTALDPDRHRGAGEIWRGEETRLDAGDLAVGRPLQGGGVGVFLVGSGTGLRVRATSSDSKILGLATGPDTEAQEELVLTFSEEKPQHLVAVPDTELLALLTLTRPGHTDARLQIQIYKESISEFVQEQEVLDEMVLTESGITFTLTPISYAKVRASHDRGAFWSQLGALGLIAGAAWRGFWSLRIRWPRRSNDAEPATDADVPIPSMGPDGDGS
jgi:hypothetical protein